LFPQLKNPSGKALLKGKNSFLEFFWGCFLHGVGKMTYLHAHLYESIELLMDTLSYKTRYATPATIEKNWLVIDAEGQVLGRLASQIAYLLRGKHKVNFTPSQDCGDYIIVLNAEKVRLTGQKWSDKDYMVYSGYPGGETHLTAAEVMKRDPRRLVEEAVRRMLPKNRLGRQLFRNLRVYEGASHDHQAQNPVAYQLKYDSKA
jgi:large subunit ribosomal protein L13